MPLKRMGVFHQALLMTGQPTKRPKMPEKVAAEFDRFVEENYREIFGTAYRLSGSADDAADLTQETFKNVLGAMTGGSRPENARAYLLTTPPIS